MNKRTQISLVVSSAMLAFGTAQVQAAQLEVTVTNATKGIYFTPILAAAHDSNLFMFRTGETASAELESMAEGGDISGLLSLIANAGGVVVENPASGILNPGVATTFDIDTGDLAYLSLGAMLLPTNDGFVGLDSWKIPTQAGTYKTNLNSYDAGTETNDELAASMPNPPFITFGAGGTGVETALSNTKVHVHPGNLGDSDPVAGISDLDSSSHRWLNPVATITIVVK
ncbi:Spondin domain-containing protein [Vibrio crassostreae]|uniref:spondin domain-containing protein n=1 Tax=Vibrio crassostreae TaxID=246167 RepID=UPI001B30DD07|nr:spondin domain-containing protein [Vibrio crassostreae]CAK1720765.1 Spondin domain-containing protein [Vibrio crassostreae]CAK1722287.1 Spondin domain-containing protein [Vibrio crassostreae]CAK2536109.1 Spondin domain-containing protein [Vibrio crassostreae]CAK2538566.1 Spondin domain-containing protein [Vibrio crassostreae]CAK2586994.1 Spondin domain-containing protein [Vibrio crassostreae]